MGAPRGQQQLFPVTTASHFLWRSLAKMTSQLAEDIKKERKLFKNAWKQSWKRQLYALTGKSGSSAGSFREPSRRLDPLSLIIKSPAATNPHTCKGSQRRKLDYLCSSKLNMEMCTLGSSTNSSTDPAVIDSPWSLGFFCSREKSTDGWDQIRQS